MNFAVLDSLYKEVILEHQKDPRNFGHLDNPDFQKEGFNPLCGDRVTIDLKLDETKEKVSQCRFHGEGCSICMASASMMAEEIEGLQVVDIKKLIQDFRDLMQGKKSPEELEGDIVALSGVKNFPVRIKCALLSWVTLKDALEHSDGTTRTE